jgi:hypothetical protein
VRPLYCILLIFYNLILDSHGIVDYIHMDNCFITVVMLTHAIEEA